MSLLELPGKEDIFALRVDWNIIQLNDLEDKRQGEKLRQFEETATNGIGGECGRLSPRRLRFGGANKSAKMLPSGHFWQIEGKQMRCKATSLTIQSGYSVSRLT